MSESEIAEMLPYAGPAGESDRLLLFALRRVASAGLNDAHAANAFIGVFGLSFRRPLILLRALMAEVSRISERRILVAPCCCPRMTMSEATLMGAIATAVARPHEAHRRICITLGVTNALGALSSAQAMAQSFEDLGRPLATG